MNAKAKYCLYAAGAGLLIAAALFYYLFFTPFSQKSDTFYIYIDNDDTPDSVMTKLDTLGNSHSMSGFSIVARYCDYDKTIKTGRYAIVPGEKTYHVFRRLQLGRQEPVKVTVPSVRTMDRLAATLDKQLMLDSATIASALTSEEFCKKHGYDTATIAAFFIPNTYEMYWNVGMEGLMKRLQREHDNYWNATRRDKAKAVGLTPVEVATLASIIDEETANNAEKPTIAGLYLNRLKIKMPLQACPTVKFALKQFHLRRIYNDMLTTDSPYNTYINTGLPPGPIRIPTVSSLEAVLNPAKHDYLYMCAKEDFSGTHNFAATYAKHLENSRRYNIEQNKRGIR